MIHVYIFVRDFFNRMRNSAPIFLHNVDLWVVSPLLHNLEKLWKTHGILFWLKKLYSKMDGVVSHIKEHIRKYLQDF